MDTSHSAVSFRWTFVWVFLTPYRNIFICKKLHPSVRYDTVGNTPFERSLRKYDVRMYDGFVCQCCCELSVLRTGVKFVQQMRHYYLLKKVSVPLI